MKLETFFEKFEQFAEAPNAVAKMRELILHLAVHGKLVEQCNEDEPASTLLLKSRAAMATLMASGQAKKEKPAEPVLETEATFALPVFRHGNPDGEIAAETATEADELLVHTCDLDATRFGKESMFDFARHRRIEHYGLIATQTGIVPPAV